MLNSQPTHDLLSAHAGSIVSIAFVWSLLLCSWTSDSYRKKKHFFIKALSLILQTFFVSVIVYFPFVVIGFSLFFSW